MRQKLALLEVSLEEYNRLREVAGFEPYFFDNPERGFQLLTRVEFPNLAGLLGEVVSVPMRLGLLGAHDRPIGEAAYRTKSDRERYFKELIAIGRYHKGRYFADAKVTVGTRGLDFTSSGARSNYGGNIYRDYDEQRYADTGVKTGQGNKTNILIIVNFFILLRPPKVCYYLRVITQI